MFARYSEIDDTAGDSADSKVTQVDFGVNYLPHPNVVLKADGGGKAQRLFARLARDFPARRSPCPVGSDRALDGAILTHPEYHALLDQPERYLERDYQPESGETNPFLHLSMHFPSH